MGRDLEQALRDYREARETDRFSDDWEDEQPTRVEFLSMADIAKMYEREG